MELYLFIYLGIVPQQQQNPKNYGKNHFEQGNRQKCGFLYPHFPPERWENSVSGH